MHIPTLLANEHSRGFQGRVRRLNGEISLGALRQHMATTYPETKQNVESYNWARGLAQVSQVGVDRFVADHTLVPFLRTVHNESAGLAHGTTGTHWQFEQAGLVLAGKTANFCQECMRTDLSAFGFAYWRRSHQLPGAVLCEEHGSVLLETASDAPKRGMPTDFEKTARPIRSHLVLDALHNPIIQQYTEICRAFLNSESPIHAEQAVMRLSARAQKRGLRTSTTGVNENLSDYAISMLAGPWLNEFFPCLTGKRPGKFLARIDGVCTSKHTPYHASAYALALALLWDEPKAALAEFYRQIEPTERDIRTPSDSFLDRIGKSTVAVSLRHDRNIHVPNIQRAIEFFLAGSSLAEAGKMYNVCAADLENVLRGAAAKKVSPAPMNQQAFGSAVASIVGGTSQSLDLNTKSRRNELRG